MRKRIRKILLIVILSPVILLFALWLGLWGLLVATENHWLGAPPFHEATDVRLRKPHRITLIDDGSASLSERLRMIESAQKSLDLEFFIWELDTSSRIVTQALADRARSGVKVRLLVDMALPVFRLRPALARELTAAGIDVRYYNASSLVRFFRVHHRTHRKLLIADGTAAMLGGRNVADDYFDLSPRYNFLDSDVIVEGPIVATIRESFDLYWSSPWALSPESVTGESSTTEMQTAANFLQQGESERQALALLRRSAPPVMPRTICPDVQFVTDYPGSGVNHRKVFPEIINVLREARREVLVESPYFVLRPDGLAAIKAVTQRGIFMQILTNSLRSTDAWYTVGALAPILDDLRMPHFRLLAWRGDPLAGYGQWPPRSKRWGVHAKRAVIDDDKVLIGTYNIDPRSANFNSELMLICRGDRGLANVTRASIERRMRQADVIVAEDAELGSLTAGADAKSYLLMWLSLPLTQAFAFLL